MIQRILLIDDDPDESIIFRYALNKIDSSLEFRHLTCPGDVSEEDKNYLLDIVFLDINMPEKDGFEWLKCIRSKGHKFPVVMYSTSRDASFLNRAYTEGADLYVHKPTSVNILIDCLRSILLLNWKYPREITAQYIKKDGYQAFGD